MTKTFSIIRALLLTMIVALLCTDVWSQKTDNSKAKSDSLHYPIKDRRGDRFTWKNNNPFDLPDTGFVKQNIRYDPITKEYYIEEKIGNTIYRKPTYLTFDEYSRIQAQQAESDYFKERSKTLSLLNQKIQRPHVQVYDNLFDRIFGLGPKGLKVEIKPQGNVDLAQL